MSKETKVTYRCDLCGLSPNQFYKGGPDMPPGWVCISIESPHVARDFTDKHVCAECASCIVVQRGKTS